jgi:hypothetical protein
MSGYAEAMSVVSNQLQVQQAAHNFELNLVLFNVISQFLHSVCYCDETTKTYRRRLSLKNVAQIRYGSSSEVTRLPSFLVDEV